MIADFCKSNANNGHFVTANLQHRSFILRCGVCEIEDSRWWLIYREIHFRHVGAVSWLICCVCAEYSLWWVPCDVNHTLWGKNFRIFYFAHPWKILFWHSGGSEARIIALNDVFEWRATEWQGGGTGMGATLRGLPCPCEVMNQSSKNRVRRIN